MGTQIIKAGGGIPLVLFEIASVRSDSRKTVTVTFTDKPKAEDRTAARDALNTSNWNIAPITPNIGEIEYLKAWVTVNIQSISPVKDDPYSIDITVDVDFTFGITYQISMVGAGLDRADNPAQWLFQQWTAQQFLGFDPACRATPMPNVFDWFGRGARALDTEQDGERFAAIVQDMFEQIKSLIDCFAELIDPLYCPPEVLDSRMESLGNPFFDLIKDMTVTERRRVALQLIPIYRAKGTHGGIKLAIQQILGLNDIYVEFFQDNTWRLGTAFYPDTTGVAFKLGGGVYVPDGSMGASYPTDPLDPHYIPNEDYIGNSKLGPGVPQYTQSILGNTITSQEYVRISRLDGQWNLSDPSEPRLGRIPDADVDESTIVQEQRRRGIYSFRIVSATALTALQRSRIIILAKYMKPAHTHLLEIREPPESYDPMILDTSALGFDWTLH